MDYETWRPVVGWCRYEVSNWGNVRSLFFVSRSSSFRHDEPRILKPMLARTGYLRVNLYKPGENRHFSIHRIVLEAFVGPCPDGYQACHYNGIKTDNRLVNLGWVTGKENQRHRICHGTALYGQNNPFAKITNGEAIEIYKRANGGKEKLVDIGRDYGIAGQTVSDIKFRRRWKRVLPLRFEKPCP